MTSDNPRFLLAFMRRDERRQYRRTGEHAGDRSHTAIMEHECQLIRQINEARNRLEELQHMAESNEKSS
jgi:hypothetical protein